MSTTPTHAQEPTPAHRCKCGAMITWRKTANGKWMPTNADGAPHWSTCPHAKEFKKPVSNVGHAKTLDSRDAK